MNTKYIKSLLKKGKYGKVIHLIQQNLHMWSLDNFKEVLLLCSGIYDKTVNHDTFSEECVIYIMERIPIHIKSFLLDEFFMCNFRFSGYELVGENCHSIELLLISLPTVYDTFRLVKHKEFGDYCFNDIDYCIHDFDNFDQYCMKYKQVITKF
jgi:hypothetical protein